MSNSVEVKHLASQEHSFHLVDPSPWPLITGASAFLFTFGMVLTMHSYTGGQFLAKLGILSLIFLMFFWWKDVVREATFEGNHTISVQTGLKMGMLLFIVSEILFFFAFFWAFFHSSFNPNPVLGGVWPPKFLMCLNPWQVPLLNTVLLLSSGAAVTWAHHAIVIGSKIESVYALRLTLTFAIIFTALQGFEYVTAPFTISDGVYGSTFYMATGFHGFHVIVGTIFLAVGLLRVIKNQFTRSHHFGFEAAAWYWHFVDIVWLFLFVTIYWWGS